MSLLLTSCANRPKEVLSKKKMEKVMYDIYVAEAIMENDYKNFDTPEKKEIYLNKVFSTNRVSQVEWDSSLSWYSDRIDLYLRMNDSVRSRLKSRHGELESMLKERGSEKVISADKIRSKSYIPPLYSFAMPEAKKTGFRFQLDSTEIASKIVDDDLLFSFNVIGIPQSAKPNFFSLITLVYGDTTLYWRQEIEENRTYNIPIPRYIIDDGIEAKAMAMAMVDGEDRTEAIADGGDRGEAVVSDTLGLTKIYGFVHLENPIGINYHIQLYNILLGSNGSDTLFMGEDGPETLLMRDGGSKTTVTEGHSPEADL